MNNTEAQNHPGVRHVAIGAHGRCHSTPPDGSPSNSGSAPDENWLQIAASAEIDVIALLSTRLGGVGRVCRRWGRCGGGETDLSLIRRAERAAKAGVPKPLPLPRTSSCHGRTFSDQICMSLANRILPSACAIVTRRAAHQPQAAFNIKTGLASFGKHELSRSGAVATLTSRRSNQPHLPLRARLMYEE